MARKSKEVKVAKSGLQILFKRIIKEFSKICEYNVKEDINGITINIKWKTVVDLASAIVDKYLPLDIKVSGESKRIRAIERLLDAKQETNSSTK